MNGTLAWYIARSSGVVAWALLTASTIWGLAITTKIMKGRPRPAWLLDLHRYLGGLATVFVGVHIAGLVADTYVHFGPASIAVPFAGTWRRTAVAWGTTAMYLLVAVEVTSLIRTRLPKKVWRAVHVLSFPLFALATLHALTAGTDARTWLFEVAAVAAILVVAGLTAQRITIDARRPPVMIVSEPEWPPRDSAPA